MQVSRFLSSSEFHVSLGQSLLRSDLGESVREAGQAVCVCTHVCASMHICVCICGEGAMRSSNESLGASAFSLTCPTEQPGTRKGVQDSVIRGRLQPDGTAGSVCLLPGLSWSSDAPDFLFCHKSLPESLPTEAPGAFSGRV